MTRQETAWIGHDYIPDQPMMIYKILIANQTSLILLVFWFAVDQ